MEEKEPQLEPLSMFKCRYCNGEYCIPCKMNKKPKTEEIKKTDLYEEPRVK